MPKSERAKTSHLFIASGIYYGCLSVLSHIPGNTLSQIGLNLWDKAVHFSVYLVLGAILAFAMVRSLTHRKRLHALISTAAVILVLGALDETHQMFVVGRDASVGDVAADFLGGGCGALLALFLPVLVRQWRHAR